MLLPRCLIYQEKSLEEIIGDSSDEFISALLDALFSIKGLKSNELDVTKCYEDIFNDAFYLCTLATIESHKEFQLFTEPFYRKYIEYIFDRKLTEYGHLSNSPFEEAFRTAVLSIFYCCVRHKPFNIRPFNFKAEIIQYLNSTLHNFSTFSDFEEKTKRTVCNLSFEQKDLKAADLYEYDWVKLTKGFDWEQIKMIVECAKTPEEKDLIISHIGSEGDRYSGGNFNKAALKIQLNTLRNKYKGNKKHKPTATSNCNTQEQKSLEECIAEHEDEMREKVNFISELKKSIDELRSENDRLRSENGRLRSDCIELKKSIDELRCQNEELRSQKVIEAEEPDVEPVSDNFSGSPRQVILLFKELGVDLTKSEYVASHVASFLSQWLKINNQNIRKMLGNMGPEDSAQNVKDRAIVHEIVQMMKK